ncbi:TetR/AcrR family transcriptional regulator [Myxococcota bacterium]|nr:TetR/AcrR family transcriptional regulator [Myxococcota bacterium]
MTKGDETRQVIVTRAMELAATVGLEGISIGKLAEDLELSKSGLFAHFKSKENLQLAIIQATREQFVVDVVSPALKKGRGEPRVRALFEHWLDWGERPGGCLFVSAAVELDDQPGPVRDALAQAQKDLLDAIATAARIAVEEGHFRKNLDTTQFAFELYALVLGTHHFGRFLRDPAARKRARKGLDALLEASR